MKKVFTELSDEELLDLLGKNPSNLEKVYNWPTDVMDFISFYNLKQGSEHITSKLLYKLYKQWSKNPINSKTFATTLTDIFPSSNSGKYTIILLDKKALNISNELYKYLEVRDKTKSKNWTKHFQDFLNHYSLKKGRLYIPNSVLYNLYDKWIYRNDNYHPLGYYQFNKFCKLFFKQKSIRCNSWSSVNKSIEQYLTDDLIQLMKASKNDKKKNAKKPS